MNAIQRVYVLLILIFACSIQANGQVVTLSDMIKLVNMNQDEIENFTLSKGYSYMDTHQSDNDFKTFFYYHKNRSIYHTITFRYYREVYLIEVGFSTSKQEEFVSLKSQMKQRGFLFNSSENVGNKIVQNNYKKESTPEYKILTYQFYVEDIRRTDYHISIQKEIK